MIGSWVQQALRTEQGTALSFTRVVTALGEGFTRLPVRSAYLATVGLLAFLFPFGLVFNLTGVLIGAFPWTSSVFIVLIAFVTLLSEMRDRAVVRVVAEFAVLASVLWGVERIGVITGIPFGDYHYTPVLGFAIAEVPLAIPCAWYATVMNSWRIADLALAGGVRRGIAVPVYAGFLTIALDLVLEPMAAMVKHYWNWAVGFVPIQNYIAWFAFSAVAVALLRTFGEGRPTGRGNAINALALLGLQWILFAVVGAAHGHVLPVVISAGVLSVLVLLRRSAT